jgi:HPt (histidine-containing phosphotransfer) domain-containing protein
MKIEKLAKARETYRARLAERVDELAALLARANAGQVEAVASAQQLAHQIYGSAGTFGFVAVGEVARTIDQRLLGLRSGELQATHELYAELGAHLERARADLAIS